MPHTYNQDYLDVLTYGLNSRSVKITDGVKKTTFLTDVLFGKNGVITNQRSFDIKIKTSSRVITEQGEFGAHGSLVDTRGGYSVIPVVFPYYHPEDTVTSDDLEQLRFDEDPLNPLTEEERAVLRLEDVRNELAARIDTDVEVTQAMSILSRGKISVKGHSDNNFKIPNTCFYDATSDKLSSASDKLKWLKTQAEKARTSGKNPTMIIAPSDVIHLLLNDAQIVALLDNRRIEQDGLNFQAYDDDLVAYHGKLAIPGFGNMKLLTYAGQYTNANGRAVDIFPATSILFASENIGTKNYGAVYGKSKVGVSEKIAAKFRDDVRLDDKNGHPIVLTVEHQASILLAPAQVGGWCYVSNAI